MFGKRKNKKRKNKLNEVVFYMTEKQQALNWTLRKADSFDVVRRLTIMDAMNRRVFGLTGTFSVDVESNRITIIEKTSENEYKRYLIGLAEWMLWMVEDISETKLNASDEEKGRT